MESHRVEQLFDFHRFPNDRLQLLLLLLYSPVGVCLMLLRIFIGLHAFLVSCILPHSFIRRCVVRVMCLVLGIYVKLKNPWKRGRNVKLYVCNHVTHFDHNVINILTLCNTPTMESSSRFLCWARGLVDLGPMSSPAELSVLLQRYFCSQDTVPLLLFPEGDTTNGRAGLLKFSSLPFTLTETVQPIALTARRPWITVSTAGSSWVTELLWTFFVPFTMYQVRGLSPVSRQGDLPEVFARKVQELIATELGMVSTQITRADKAEYIKRNRHVSPQTGNSSVVPGARPVGLLAPQSGMEHLGISGMAQQVKEVFPDAPLGAITGELVPSNCLDKTIANLLEGRGTILTESSGGAVSGPVQSNFSSSISAMPSSLVQLTVKTFGKSPIDRHLALQQRKDALYEYARRRFMAIHGLEQMNTL